MLLANADSCLFERVQFLRVVYLLQACNLRLSVLCFCMSKTSGLNLLSGCSLFSRFISFANWNIRTLVESAGDDLRICRVRPDTKSCHLLSIALC